MKSRCDSFGCSALLCAENLSEDIPRASVEAENDSTADRAAELTRGNHPYGVQPSGNALVAGAAASCRDQGLGRYTLLWMLAGGK